MVKSVGSGVVVLDQNSCNWIGNISFESISGIITQNPSLELTYAVPECNDCGPQPSDPESESEETSETQTTPPRTYPPQGCALTERKPLSIKVVRASFVPLVCTAVSKL